MKNKKNKEKVNEKDFEKITGGDKKESNRQAVEWLRLNNENIKDKFIAKYGFTEGRKLYTQFHEWALAQNLSIKDILFDLSVKWHIDYYGSQ